MALPKLKQSPKSGPLGFVAKVSIAIVLGLSFAVIWSTFSPTSSEAEVSSKRNSFEGEILDPESKIPTPAKAKVQEKERKKEKDASLEKSNSNATVELSKQEEEKLKENGTEVEVKEEREEQHREEGREEQGEGEDQSGTEPSSPIFLILPDCTVS
jgi:DNA-binding helix-hairpin-helix protein with protein kinase domain